MGNVTRVGAMAVVLSPDRREVLLLRRRVLFLWDLPGGELEPGEEPGAAAARETREETGYEVEVVRPVGRYRHPSLYGTGEQLTHAYEARVAGGEPIRRGPETGALAWRATIEASRALEALQRAILEDALAASGPVERRVEFPRWKLWPARAAFVALRALRRRRR